MKYKELERVAVRLFYTIKCLLMWNQMIEK